MVRTVPHMTYDDRVPPFKIQGGGRGAEIERSPVPTGVAVFPQDIAIRRYAEGSNTITYWSEFDRGGRFAAMETPDLLVDDVRTFFRTVR
jgi:epoxide hydrolase